MSKTCLARLRKRPASTWRDDIAVALVLFVCGGAALFSRACFAAFPGSARVWLRLALAPLRRLGGLAAAGARVPESKGKLWLSNSHCLDPIDACVRRRPRFGGRALATRFEENVENASSRGASYVQPG